MGVVTAQILILIISGILPLIGWVLIRRAMNRLARRASIADSVLLVCQDVFANQMQTDFTFPPSDVAREPAPPRAPPAFLLRRNRLTLAE